MKKFLQRFRVPLTTLTSCMSMGVVAFAGEATPTSLMDDSVLQIVKDFAADIVPTVMAIVAVVVPVGLTLWGISFAVKKGIAFLQRRASKSV